jgi:hypothetical protein
MPSTNQLSTNQLREALRLSEQIEQLQQRLNGLVGGTGSTGAARGRKRAASGRKGKRFAQSAKSDQGAIPSSVGSTGGKAKRIMSPEARAKIAAAQRARWAKQEKSGESVVRTEMIALPKKKGGLTAEGRARLAAAMKARWASAKRKGESAPNVKASA